MGDWTNMVIVHGLPWPDNVGVTEEKVAVFPRLPAREDDIFIVSYPRSGSFDNTEYNTFLKTLFEQASKSLAFKTKRSKAEAQN